MEAKVKPEAKESTMIATKKEDEMKNMKECVVIGQEADEEISKIEETTKFLEVLRQNSDQTRKDDSRKDSSSSSSLEMIKKLENEKNWSQNAENTKKEEEKKKESQNVCSTKNKKTTSSHVWDCGSTLYDSFELDSFKRQLDSAITASSARTMSMSHIPDRRIPLLNSLSPEHTLPPATSSSSSSGKKHSNKISRSLQRLLKSVFFRPKQTRSLSSSTSSPVYNYKAGHGGDKDRYYVVYDKPGSLTTIPESTEKEVGPEINSLIKRTVSERFPASRVVGISCA